MDAILPPPTTNPTPSELTVAILHGLDMKEELAARIQVHLLFSPGQEETWTLLERKFPKATEQQFNAAIAHLEMTDMITIDPHPHCLDEFLIKIDYDLVETPPPMPWPSFRFPALDTPLGTGTVLSSVSVSETHTPTRAVRFVPTATTHNSGGARSAAGVGSGGEPDDLVYGAWSHTPPRLRDALGEADELLEEEEQEEAGWEQEEHVASGGEDGVMKEVVGAATGGVGAAGEGALPVPVGVSS